MLQNRVDPFGHIIATSARGAWLGNRGVIHNERKEIIRPFKHKAWIICQLSFKNRHRQVMTPNRWTELFFLDEATALSAGHRPCFECRREAAVHFKECWIKGNPNHGFTSKNSIQLIDEIIHHERTNLSSNLPEFFGRPSDLPNGTFVSLDSHPHLLQDGKFMLWTPFGYKATTLSETSHVFVITPQSIVNAMLQGYVPQVNEAKI